MKSIEDYIVDKIFSATNYVLSKIIKPDINIENVRQLNEEEITKIKERYGIEGVILDVDDTLRKDMKDIPRCNQEWIEQLRSQLKVIVVSNGIDKNIEQFLKEKDIEYIGFANKPLKKNFIKACEKMNIEPEEVLVIGDGLFADIYGGKRNNMKTALVNQVEDER